MFSKQSKEFLEREEKNERRIMLWRGAVGIVKSLAEAHTDPSRFDDCGWRGDHRDVAAVADYLDTMQPDSMSEQIAEAATWINGERERDPHGLRVMGRPIVHELLGHLRRKFPHGG